MSNFIFLNPWLLIALLSLPALWFLLRVMPPTPKKVFLPSAHFLKGLSAEAQTSSKTPWWILLLRALIAALVILAFASPVFNPSQDLNSERPLRIIIDNGWSAADLWDQKINSATDLIAQSKRQNVSVYIHTTSAEAPNGDAFYTGPIAAQEATSVIKGLTPKAWGSDYNLVLDSLAESDEAIDSFILSDGINGKGLKALTRVLSEQGRVRVFSPTAENLPIILARKDARDRELAFTLAAPDALPKGTLLTLQALGQDERILGVQNIVFKESSKNIALNLPDILQRDLKRVRILEREDAGSIYLFGDQFDKKRVGIANPDQDDGGKPFIEASFYLTRALEPYADVINDGLARLLSSDVSMIILPDVGTLSPSELSRLDDWVRGGGMLLRFAGPAMEQVQQHFLLPTPLRSGTRSLDGALTWDAPPKLSHFNDASPLAGIAISEDIMIKKQLLAQPSEDLPSKSWATLDDGTPLVTADSLDRGMVVMVHTTASPDWSNLPLSGVFVQMLERFVKIAGRAPISFEAVSGAFEAKLVLDGKGNLVKPDSNVQMIDAADFATTRPSFKPPPGIYAQAGVQRVLNIGDHISALSTLPDDLSVDARIEYGATHEKSLMPLLLSLAFALFILDWIIMILIANHFQFNYVKLRKPSVVSIALFFLVCSFCAPSSAMAETQDAYKYANGLYLGFIKSSNSALNSRTRQGLEALKDNLARRTSVEPSGVASIDPEKDILAFFPLIYWPVDARDQALSDAAIQNIQSYLDQGGTILFDTREQSTNANQAALSRITSGLNIPALSPIEDGHVLGKSFYLLNNFAVLYSGGSLWLEGNSVNGRDGVSSVIIGSHDWAGAWAQSAGRDYRSGASARQREMAIRFGVNVMMYALTGNYKADQVHVKHILERLGQ